MTEDWKRPPEPPPLPDEEEVRRLTDLDRLCWYREDEAVDAPYCKRPATQIDSRGIASCDEHAS